MNLDDVKKVFCGKSAEDVLIKGLQHYLDTDEADLEVLKAQFDGLEYNSITEPVSYFKESILDIINNWNEYEWLYSALQDEISRATLCHMLMAKLTLDTTFIERAFSEEPIYFSKQIWGRLSQETYIDCGAFDGDTVDRFVVFCPNYAKIYAFEPVPEVMRLCENNLKDLYSLPNANIVYMNYAVSDFQGEVSFDAGTMNGESKQSETGSIKCKCIPIDLIDEKNISFIKMDIEGSEAAAIIGAKGVISSNTPKMAICIYHKPGDFWKIPRLIKSINPNYRFMIRQHDYEVFSETVLYCIPTLLNEMPTENWNEALNRLCVAIGGMHNLSKSEYQNLLQHGKDKKWFLSQLRTQKRRLCELEDWTVQLEKVRAYDEEQIKLKDARIVELDNWTSQLEKVKAYDEKQIKLKDARIVELDNWTSQLEKVKAYDEEQIRSKDARITELESWTGELEKARTYDRKQIDSKDARIAELENWIKELEAAKSWLLLEMEKRDSKIEDLVSQLVEINGRTKD